ncbi:MAG: glycosyltransferase family 4 protein [Bacteroidota bacterium]
MIKIALVRGHHLSKEETLSYEPLRNEFEFVCFSSDNPWFDHSEIVFPIVEVASVEKLFHFLPVNLSRRSFGVLDHFLGAGQWMYGLDRKLKGFNIVHTSDYCHFFSYQAALAKKRLGYKLVAIHYDNIPFARDDKPVARHIKYELYDKADALFAMSERARESLLLEGVDRRKISVIGNAIDTKKFTPREDNNPEWRQQYSIALHDTVILFVGRLHESKGVFELVYAAKKLVSDPDIDSTRLHFIMAGEGPRHNDVNSLINRLNLQNHVTLIGRVAHSEIHQLHSMADVFALPSIAMRYWQEQFGIVLIESMASGKAIVSTCSGSIPEVVGDSAILVQPNDHYSLYLELKKLVLDKKLRHQLGMKARARAVQCFSQEVIADKLRNAYLTVVERS